MSAPLLESPDNPLPANAYADWLTMDDGRRIRYARFAAEGRPHKGTVIIFTGRNESIEKYFETIRDLSARGFGSALMDWRGQGLSDRLIRNSHRGHIDDFADYVGDIEPFFERVILPDCRSPFYVLGHSMGALVALLAAPTTRHRVRRMVLSAPLLNFAGLPFSIHALKRLSSAFCAVGLGSLRLGGATRWTAETIETNAQTSDPRRHRRNTELYSRHPSLALGAPSAAWLRAACIAIERAENAEFMSRLQVPTLFVAAGNDEVVSTPHVERYARRLRGASLVTIDGARHELLQETDLYREQFLAAFDAFIPGSDPS